MRVEVLVVVLVLIVGSAIGVYLSVWSHDTFVYDEPGVVGAGVQKKEGNDGVVTKTVSAQELSDETRDLESPEPVSIPEPKPTPVSEPAEVTTQPLAETLAAVEPESVTPAVTPEASPLGRSFSDSFSGATTLEEIHDPLTSQSADWWLNSGAYLYREDGRARTVFGALPKGSSWQIRYANGARDIPSETDGGFYPQNIFRLLTRSKWQDAEQTLYYNIDTYNLSDDKHRSQSNALLLFHRYYDSDNLYYLGLRVDGAVVIKKKYQGNYTTLAYQQVLEGTYDRETRPNLIPLDTWIGVRGRVVNEDSGVRLQVFLDVGRTGSWQKVLEIVDRGQFDGPPLLEPAWGGVRTDFMDVWFDDYQITEL